MTLCNRAQPIVHSAQPAKVVRCTEVAGEEACPTVSQWEVVGE
jgi:hypothetical protein